MELPEGAFHYKDNIFAKRILKGDVMIWQTDANGETIWSVIIDNASWCSVVAHVSFNSDRPAQAFHHIRNFHNQDEF